MHTYMCMCMYNCINIKIDIDIDIDIAKQTNSFLSPYVREFSVGYMYPEPPSSERATIQGKQGVDGAGFSGTQSQRENPYTFPL